MNRYLITGIVATLLWEAVFSKAWTQPPSCIPQSYITTTSVNSWQQNKVILIGKMPKHPYVVVVPGHSEKLLNDVRSYITDAFLSQNRRGLYIYAGGFSQREEAECLSIFLRSHKLDARVVYFH